MDRGGSRKWRTQSRFSASNSRLPRSTTSGHGGSSSNSESPAASMSVAASSPSTSSGLMIAPAPSTSPAKRISRFTVVYDTPIPLSTTSGHGLSIGSSSNPGSPAASAPAPMTASSLPTSSGFIPAPPAPSTAQSPFPFPFLVTTAQFPLVDSTIASAGLASSSASLASTALIASSAAPLGPFFSAFSAPFSVSTWASEAPFAESGTIGSFSTTTAIPAASAFQVHWTASPTPFGMLASTNSTPFPTTGQTSIASVDASTGTISISSASLSTTPTLHSEIAGKQVGKIIKHWNAELEEQTMRFYRQSSAVADWDRWILKKRDILGALEMEVAQVWKTNVKLERDLELIETYQNEVDKALQSVEAEAEHILGDWQGLLFDDEAASERDAMYVWAEIVEKELDEIRGNMKAVIHNINSNRGGESRSPLDVAQTVLNNQLTCLMSIDQKAEELKSRIQN